MMIIIVIIFALNDTVNIESAHNEPTSVHDIRGIWLCDDTSLYHVPLQWSKSQNVAQWIPHDRRTKKNHTAFTFWKPKKQQQNKRKNVYECVYFSLVVFVFDGRKAVYISRLSFSAALIISKIVIARLWKCVYYNDENDRKRWEELFFPTTTTMTNAEKNIFCSYDRSKAATERGHFKSKFIIYYQFCFDSTAAVTKLNYRVFTVYTQKHYVLNEHHYNRSSGSLTKRFFCFFCHWYHFGAQQNVQWKIKFESKPRFDLQSFFF